jgi:predicted peptidase
MAALDSVEQRWSVDSDRVTLAGLSYGGLGVWEIGAKHPIASSGARAGGKSGAKEAVDRLILLPVWAFNFQGDWSCRRRVG